MFRPLTSHRPRSRQRRGAILIVVLALLTLFTIIAISFVYFADSEANAARIHREGENRNDEDKPDSTEAVNRFLGSFIFDTQDTNGTTNDLQNAVRGHSLMATMYGRQPGASIPFNGVGTFHEPVPSGVPDRVYWQNYTAMSISGNPVLVDPEWTGTRQTNAGPPVTFAGPPTFGGAQSYIPKNAGYTYPDANNLFLAAASPQTGEVLVPSFYRAWMFRHATQNANNTGLEPNNPNWQSPQGRAMILRPRPIDNIANSGDGRGAVSDFPYPPVNADGSYTGDVQNLWGGVGTQKNDSILMDVGLAPRLWNGKLVKPLVAALILDLDGRINLNAHTSYRGSYSGFGPWEVDASRVIGGDAGNVLGARYNNPPGAVARSATTRQFDTSGQRLPQYGLVNWDAAGGGTVSPPNFGTGTPFTTSATYGGGYEDNTNAAKYTNHPGLYNPNEWPGVASGSSRTFPHSDFRQLSLRYADRLDRYQGMDIAGPASASLVNSGNTGNNYRIDASHANRLSVTTLSAGLDRPGLMANFQLLQPGNALQLGGVYPNRLFPPNPGFPGTFPNPGGPGPLPPGATTDTNTGDLRNVRTFLGPVDLNRSLTPYFAVNTAPVPGGAPNPQAIVDRYYLARDIFARLIVASGGLATVNFSTPDPTKGYIQILAAPGTPEYQGLRYLAQLAANMVDYIDADDISTPFVWNPADPADPMNPSNFAPGELQNRVVFGIEKPKLVINEAYGEIANQPGIALGAMPPPMGSSAHVRFWVELLNPTTTPYAAGGNGPQGTGAATLRYPALGFSPYRLQIWKNTRPAGATARDTLRDPNNVTGDVTGAPEAQYDFTPEATSPGSANTVAPNNGSYAAGGGNPANGVIVVGPTIPGPAAGMTPSPIEFNPAPTGGVGPPPAPWNNMLQSPAPGAANAMGYTVPITNVTTGYLTDASAKRHVVVLQRLANPYIAPGVTNPYITVDYMDWVWATDAVIRADTNAVNRLPYDPTTAPTGYDPIGTRAAAGKVQPHAGLAEATAPVGPGQPTYAAYPSSFVQAQNPAGAAGTEPLHTFGRHNGTTATGPAGAVLPSAGGETIKAPYDWLVHFDRPLVNQLELIQTRACRPTDLTQLFAASNGAAGVRYDLGYAPWFGSNPTAAYYPGYDTTSGLTHNGLFRAFDVLRVKPWGYGAGMGGRVHGRININTIQDQRVWRALVNDPSGGIPAGTADTLWSPSYTPPPPTSRLPIIIGPNGRTTNFVVRVQADGSTQWDVPNPWKTIDDAEPGDPNAANYERPFKPFGTGEFLPSGAYSAQNGSGLRDTILRLDPTGTFPLLNGSLPLVGMPPNNDPYSYLQGEVARKIINNTTTVSNTFAVYITVVFHEVRRDSAGNAITVNEGGINRFILGKEAYREVPGDTRQQFFAVVDRSNVGLAPGTTNLFAGRPFYTSLEGAAPVGSGQITIAAAGGSVYADGSPVPLTNSVVIIGVGPTAETRTISGVVGAGPIPGSVVVNLNNTLNYNHGAGECVSNVQPGNPGPQPSFDRANNSNSVYQYVVPYIARTR